jgi:hypothetical protein
VGSIRLTSRAAWIAIGAVLLVLCAAAVPLSGLARQNLNAGGGGVPVWVSVSFGVTGLVLAWRRPGNALGWIMLAGAFFGAVTEDASYYTVADYGLRHGDLPLGGVALLAQPSWAPAIVSFGLLLAVFPDGRLPAARWRWLVGAYIAVAAVWIIGAIMITASVLASHHVRVDVSGNLLQLNGNTPGYGWWNLVQNLFFPLLLACWLASLAGQALSFRRSSGIRRQQLKWLLTGSAVALVGVAFGVLFRPVPLLSGVLAAIGFLAVPVSIGVAVLRYRLFDIDRIVSRTLAYAIVTGLLVGVYAGLVLLTTEVFGFHTPVAVAASTLAAAALFSPVRRRVQRLVDRRFNRARYDAETTVAAFADRLKDSVNLDSVRADLAATVHQALEPAHLSVWINPR